MWAPPKRKGRQLRQLTVPRKLLMYFLLGSSASARSPLLSFLLSPRHGCRGESKNLEAIFTTLPMLSEACQGL